MLRISGSATSSTRTPHTTPVMSPTCGFIRGAFAKKVAKSTLRSSAWRNAAPRYPVSHSMIASTSAWVRPLRSAFCTYSG
jgi:hypothetical protein